MRISILNPAPDGPRQQSWGDFHFGLSLQKALERKGVVAKQHYWPNWVPEEEADAVIVLRGRRRIIPKDKRRPWLLWIISHPSDISLEEVNSYTIVSPASETFSKILRGATKVPTIVLRQCTDTRIFNTANSELDAPEDREGMIFVANSRNVRRQMVQWAANTGMRPALIGDGWDIVGYDDLVIQDYVENHELPRLYRRFQLGLNDHWGDMRYFGIISNRIFDCLACGLPVLSDRFPELESVFGDGLLYADNERMFWESVWMCKTRFTEIFARVNETWGRLEEAYTFDARAEKILDLFEHIPESKNYQKILAEDVKQLIGSVKSQHEGMSHILHVQPTAVLTHTLSDLESFTFTRVGLGLGPWDIDMDRSASQLANSFYDGVLFDEGPFNLEYNQKELQRFICGICRSLKPFGTIMVIHRTSNQDTIAFWSELLSGNGLRHEHSASKGEWRLCVFSLPEESHD